jgi:hypothetical protein
MRALLGTRAEHTHTHNGNIPAGNTGKNERTDTEMKCSAAKRKEENECYSSIPLDYALVVVAVVHLSVIFFFLFSCESSVAGGWGRWSDLRAVWQQCTSGMVNALVFLEQTRPDQSRKQRAAKLAGTFE